MKCCYHNKNPADKYSYGVYESDNYQHYQSNVIIYLNNYNHIIKYKRIKKWKIIREKN